MESTSHGASTGSGGSAGLTLCVTNAPHVRDLTDKSDSYGLTVVGLAGMSIDYVTFVPASRPDTVCWGH